MCTTEMTDTYANTSPSPGQGNCCRTNVPDDDDEISVGCPSPLPLLVEGGAAASPRSGFLEDEERYEPGHRSDVTSLGEEEEEVRGACENVPGDDYFKPLKRLKMAMPAQGSDDEDEKEREASERGVKSFSILDILSHRPKAKIVRPWDTAESMGHHHQGHHHFRRRHHQSGPRDLSLVGISLGSISGSVSEPPLSSSSSSGRSSVSDSGSPDPLLNQHHLLQHGLQHLHHPGMQHQQFKRKVAQQGQVQNGKRTTGQGSPLDALFQMTSKTFDAGEHSQGGSWGVGVRGVGVGLIRLLRGGIL